MTTRRGFLGVLAVAPFAKPAIAEVMASPNYAKGGIWQWGQTLSGIVGETAGESILPLQHGLFYRIDASGVSKETEAVLREQLAAALPAAPRELNWNDGPCAIRMRADGETEIHPLQVLDVPNRLYGAAVNYDGDAI